MMVSIGTRIRISASGRNGRWTTRLNIKPPKEYTSCRIHLHSAGQTGGFGYWEMYPDGGVWQNPPAGKYYSLSFEPSKDISFNFSIYSGYNASEGAWMEIDKIELF